VRSNVPEKLIEICHEIAIRGNARLTRLTVLKKWLGYPGRLPPFAIWVASRAISGKGQTTCEAAALLGQARTLLAGVSPDAPKLDLKFAKLLHDRLRSFQDEYKCHRWGAVRIIDDWNLMLVERALAIYLRRADSPEHGYKLAADYAQHYDSRWGNGLNGPSRTRIQEMARFMRKLEVTQEIRH
jgi:hypothetical protein